MARERMLENPGAEQFPKSLVMAHVVSPDAWFQNWWQQGLLN
jgi:hypothetical protein